jgi:tetratricopeptide (TPR) repeat protein
MTTSYVLLRTVSGAVALAFAASVALAASSGGGSSGGSSTGTSTSPKKFTCKKPNVAKLVKLKDGTKKWRCLKLTAGVLPDGDLLEQGKALALDGEYDWALDVLATVQDQKNPDVLNMQGYSHRKSGRLDVAITYYRKALAIKPDFVRAREYLGEGYIAAGRVDLAQAELQQIKVRCGETCEEYQDLAKAIASAAN